MPQLKVQNFYSTALTSDITGTGDTSFTVTVAPTYTSGFLVISPNNASLREIVYFHSVVWNTISVRAENRWQWWTTARPHTSSEPVAMKDIAEIFNMFSDSISQCFFVEKTGGLTVKVWWWTVFYNWNPVTVSDTSLTLADNQTNYVKYSYPTNTISVDTINSWNIKARIVTSSWAITSIQYYVAKESYIDFTVTLTWALPAQSWNTWKVLTTDGTNASWQFNIWKKWWNLASSSIVDIWNQAWSDYFHITGTTNITSFGTASAWTRVTIVFDWILTITHNSTSLILPWWANIITSVGDSAVFESEWSWNWKCVSYTKADWTSIVSVMDINWLTAVTSIADTATIPVFITWTWNRKITKWDFRTNIIGKTKWITWTRDAESVAWAVNYAHWMTTIPRYIEIEFYGNSWTWSSWSSTWLPFMWNAYSHSIYDVSANSVVWLYWKNAGIQWWSTLSSTSPSTLTGTTAIKWDCSSTSEIVSATISVDATNVVLTWTTLDFASYTLWIILSSFIIKCYE